MKNHPIESVATELPWRSPQRPARAEAVGLSVGNLRRGANVCNAAPKDTWWGKIHPKIMVNWCDLCSWNAKHMLPKMAERMIVGTLFCVTRQTSYFLLFAMIPGEFARRNMMDSWCKSIIFIINDCIIKSSDLWHFGSNYSPTNVA